MKESFTNYPPALIIAYARSDNVLNQLEKLIRLGVKRIFVAVDGPRNPKVHAIQEELLNSIEQIADRNHETSIEIWRRDRNLGVAVSVITAIDWFFSNVTSGIILEDDLIIEDSFVNFAGEYLKRFRDKKSLLMISGNRLVLDPSEDKSFGLTRYPQTWGWATWDDRWQEIRENAYELPIDEIYETKGSIRNFWRIGTQRVLDGKIDTWDIPLANFMKSRNYYTLLPPVNLVSNAGNDDYATHTLNNDGLLRSPTQPLYNLPPVILEDLMDQVALHDLKLERYVFKIRFHHYLLPFYFLFDRLRGTFLYLEPLKQRLSQVKLPD